MSDKQHAVELLDRLGRSQLAAVVHLLERFVVEDRDTLSGAERTAISEADEWLKHKRADPARRDSSRVRLDHGRMGENGR
jgi:hypothetical protein